jgi:hypothetical protein
MEDKIPKAAETPIRTDKKKWEMDSRPPKSRTNKSTNSPPFHLHQLKKMQAKPP